MEKSKQQQKWIKEIASLEAQIPQLETSLAEHVRKLKEDTTIDFFEIQRRQESAKNLMQLIARHKKRLADLKEMV